MNHTVRYSSDGISLHPDVLKAVHLFACEDPTRPHLAGVFLDDGHLTATDGHTLIRIMSIDPGGLVPRAYDHSLWSSAYVTALLTTFRERGKARLRCSATLRWDARVARGKLNPPPCAQVLDAAMRPIKAEAGMPSAIQARYHRRLADACDLLLGKECRHKGPVLLHGGNGIEAHYYGIPWRDDSPRDEGTWSHGAGRGKPAPRTPGPVYGAEVVIMPLRIG